MPKTKENENCLPSSVEAREVITIGSDPEFAIVSADRVLDACSIIQPRNGGTSPSCDFGYDGHNATGEIRPKPKDNPKGAIEEIKQLLERNKEKYPQAYKYNLMATSNTLTLGGHIHFGNKKLLKDNELVLLLVHNLDNLLAFPTMYLENKEHATWRRTTSYGKLSSYRMQRWGFEYRTLGSFIASQKLTSCVFYLSYAIADATINDKYKCKDLISTEGFSYNFTQQYRDMLRQFLPTVFKEQKRLPKYKAEKDYKENIDLFQSLVKKEEPLFDEEIKKGWNIDFDISDYWKVEKLETLIDKITKLLIAIHTGKQNDFKPIIFNFATGSCKDLGCIEIATRVNVALNNLVDNEVLKDGKWKRLKVYGLKKSRPNEIWIGSVKKVRAKRKKQILGYLWEIASQLEHNTKIEDIMFVKDATPFSIGFGRKLREENVLIAEAMVVVTILLINTELYKNFEKKRGKKKKLLVTKTKIVNPIVDNLKSVKKFKAYVPLNKTKKLKGITLPLYLDLNKSYNNWREGLRELDTDTLRELKKEVFSTWDKVHQYIETECSGNCSSNYPLTVVEIDKLCPHHIAKCIEGLVNNFPYIPTTPRHVGVSGYCDYDEPHVICEHCGEDADDCGCPRCEGCGYRCSSDDFCYDCDLCQGCCDCVVCEECGDGCGGDDICSVCNCCPDCCNCSSCGECGQRNSSGNYCDECGSCFGCCSCEEEAEPVEDEEPDREESNQ